MSLPASADHAAQTPDLVLMRLRLARELGPHVGVACTEPTRGDPTRLWPGERAAILAAVAKRQSEYAAGRAAAREALERIGHPAAAIPSAPDRSPIWPAQVVGSLAHTNDICVAVAAWKHQVPALGIDVEPDQAMDDSLWAHVCTPDELAALNTLPPTQKGRLATHFFCAKEAFYKWQYPQTGRLLEFHDVRIEFDSDNTRFRARVDARVARQIAASNLPEGRFMRMNDSVIAFIGT
jgi:enterobactin synthetase component D